MARYNPHHDVEPIYAIVETWRDRSLIGDQALLTDETGVWSPQNIDRVSSAFKGNPDAGSDTFLVKLERQLAALDDAAKQLAADMLYVMLLFPSNIGARKKRENLDVILSWRSSPAALNTALLEDDVLGGVGSAGMGYNQNRPFEFGYFLDLMTALKSTTPDERREILSEPWAFSRFLTRVNAPGKQLAHILEHLLFPDTFERISSGTDKGRVLIGLTDEPPAKIKAMDRAGRDRSLSALRRRIAEERGPDFDFYDEEFSSRWRDAGKAGPQPSAPENAAVWAEVTSLEQGHGGPGWELGSWLWSPTTSTDGADRYSVMRGPAPGDTVYHLVAGLPGRPPRQRWLWGRSLVAKPVETVSERPSAPGSWGDAEAYYKIALEGCEPLSTPIPMDEIETRHRDDILEDLNERPKHYPYARYGADFRGSQGIYLSKLSHRLASALASPFDDPEADAAPADAGDRRPYTSADAAEEAFIPKSEIDEILELWEAKLNIILQGAPGVGKSFMAKRLAYALIGEADPDRVETVQFHQSYAYEDFVQGYRPTPNRGFALRDGVFLRVCDAARKDRSRRHVLIIDEINRGNLSKIFGELMLLIEPDKRGAEWAARLAYADTAAERFHIPDNLFIIGMMNTADRSLSMVDYALRRRFAFVPLRPQYRSDRFTAHLRGKGVPDEIIERIVARMCALNDEIAADVRNLGPGFEIGHSFFVPGRGDVFGEAWYERIVKTEIAPLLAEYWFDDSDKEAEVRHRLLAPAP